MTLKWRRRVHRHAIWPLLAISLLLSACGGGGSGILAVLQIVTPLGGDWLNGSVEKVDFNANLDTVVLFESSLNVAATVTTAENVCGGGSVLPDGTEVEVEGTLENGDLVLRRSDPPNNTSTCLEGTFTDLITLEAGPPGLATQSYTNERVDVQLNTGLWVSTGGGDIKLKFKLHNDVRNDDTDIDISGCDLSGSSFVEFEGEIDGFNLTTRAKPTITELRPAAGGATLFTLGVFVDGATMTLVKTSNGESVTLRRELDTPPTPCP